MWLPASSERRTGELSAKSLWSLTLARSKQIPPEEGMTLLRRAQAGNREAADQLIAANLRFASFLAANSAARRAGMDLGDLVGEANLALAQVANITDLKFLTYANFVAYVRRAIRIRIIV